MKTTITIEDFRRMLDLANATIKSRSQEFSTLDAAIGDGDHGEAMCAAFDVAERSAHSAPNFQTMLADMGFGVMLETSGSTSTLLGGLFLGMSESVGPVSEIDAPAVRKMMRGGLEGVKKNTRAKVGDKTIMDALIPAIDSIENSQSDDIWEIFDLAAKAAYDGAQLTKKFKSNFGRGRNLGDKTIGHLDAGATSWASVFDSFASALK